MPTKSNNIGGRGGKRIGAGRKKKSVVEKALNGNPGGRTLEVLDIPDLEGVKMPEPHEVLSSTQKDGSVLQRGNGWIASVWEIMFQSLLLKDML